MTGVHDAKPAAVVMSMERYTALLEELMTLRPHKHWAEALHDVDGHPVVEQFGGPGVGGADEFG